MEVFDLTGKGFIIDGSISAFRIHDGHVDYQQAYVKTDRFMVETKYRKNLFGKYRNPFTGIPFSRSMVNC